MFLKPAQYLIHICGGVRAAARFVNDNPGNVSRWQRTGHIPLRRAQIALKKAKAEGLDITPSDLLEGRKVD